MIKGIRSSKAERPYEFKIEELDIPIQGTRYDDEWFYNSLIPSFSYNPIHNIIDKFMEREVYLR